MPKCNNVLAGMAAVTTLVGCIESAQAGLLNEGFDTVVPAGWVATNNSDPIGSEGWFQGNAGVFSAQAGPANSYAAANFNSADIGGNISNWLLTPTVVLGNGEVFSFYTRTERGLPFPDRLEVRLSTNGASTDVGATDSSVGDFTTLLLTINPTLAVGGYPEDWTQFSITLSGLGAGATGRFAFRYFVDDTDANADYIGIDTVQLVSEPSTLASMLLACSLLGLRLWRRPLK